MAHILIMPRQGNTVESCIITDWRVKEGDTVTAQTIVCEVETDKAVFEIAAGAAGTVLKLLCEAGDDIPVLAPIAVIGAPGEDLSDVLTSAPALGETDTEKTSYKNAEGKEEKSDAADVLAFSPVSSQGINAVSPRARNLAAKEALPLNAIAGSGPGGRIIERDVTAALQNRVPLTAAAKAVGAGAIPQAGTGLGGRVTKSDLAAVSHSSFSDEGAITETPIKGIRKLIADRMFSSLAESAQFTLNTSVPAGKLQEIHSSIKTENAFSVELSLSKITINDLILFTVSRILPKFPFMNAHKIGDTIKTFERVHLAAAVDTPRGLMVPVIRNANLLSLVQISSETKRLAFACQNGTAKPDELSGSTFTVTNLGRLGITTFTPVLNAPEVAILGVGGIELKPVISDNNKCGCSCACNGLCFEPHINFSLTINHQVIDGAPAARFLHALCDIIANIDKFLAAG